MAISKSQTGEPIPLGNLVVRYQPIKALTPHPGNARTHSKRQIKQIAQSIQTFGFTNPVLVTGQCTIIAVHGRVLAAALLGMAGVPTICIDNLTKTQLRAYVIADNRLAEKAGWDNSILAI